MIKEFNAMYNAFSNRYGPMHRRYSSMSEPLGIWTFAWEAAEQFFLTRLSTISTERDALRKLSLRFIEIGDNMTNARDWGEEYDLGSYVDKLYEETVDELRKFGVIK